MFPCVVCVSVAMWGVDRRMLLCVVCVSVGMWGVDQEMLPCVVCVSVGMWGVDREMLHCVVPLWGFWIRINYCCSYKTTTWNGTRINVIAKV